MTSKELLALWDERDHRYAISRHRLTEDEEAMVMEWREKEIKLLAPNDRMKAWVVLQGRHRDTTAEVHVIGGARRLDGGAPRRARP